MSRFSVLVSALENETSNFNTYCNELSEYSSKVNSIKNVLPIYGNAGTQIKNSLKNSNINIKQLRKSSFNLSNGLNIIGKCYTEVESKSCRLNLNDVLNTTASIARIMNPATEPFAVWDLLKNNKGTVFLDVVGEFGMGGSIVSAFGKGAKVLTGQPLTFKDWISIDKDLTSAAGSAMDIIDDLESGKFSKASFWGYSTSEGSSIGTIFKDEFKDYTFKNTDKVTKKIKVGTKWAGIGLNLLSRGYDNFVDIDSNDVNNTTERKIAETITETTVDFAIDKAINIGLTAAVTAIAGFTPVGWGAVAVGVAAVGVKWAADGICKNITGKDLTETISDGIIDLSNWTTDVEIKIAKSVTGAIGGWWNKITKSPQSASS